MAKGSKEEQEGKTEKLYCFVIMPITDVEGYEPGHFRKVYEDIFRPACEMAGYEAVRADDVFKTNFIQLDILQRLLESPMAICDLSNRNPNVLFELGLRQAFDKPTVLVQEKNTPQIFDISPLRYTEYQSELKYREVVAAQESISKAILETKEAYDKNEGLNSLVKLLSISSAKIKDIDDADKKELTDILLSDLNKIKRELSSYVSSLNYLQTQTSANDSFIFQLDKYEKGINQLEMSINNNLSPTILNGLYNELSSDYSKMVNIQTSETLRNVFNILSGKLGALKGRIPYQ